MCKYKEDAPNERCTEGGAEIISRKICDQVIDIIHILYGLAHFEYYISYCTSRNVNTIIID